MAAADIEYSARFIGPELIERGRVNRLTCPVYRDGALVSVTLSGSTISIRKRDGTLAVDAAAITGITSTVPYYDTSTFSGVTLEDGWIVEWSLVISGTTRTFRRSAALCRSRLHPVITDADLYARHAELEDVRGQLTTDQSVIDESWAELLSMLGQRGTLTHLVISAEELRYAHLFLALHNRFLDLGTSAGPDSKWWQLATTYETKFNSTFSRLSLRYDTDDDGVQDTDRRPAQAVTFLGGHGTDYWPSRWGGG